MLQNQAPTNGQTETEGEENEGPQPQYYVSTETAEASNRALPLLIASRRCFMDQQADEEPPTLESDPQEFIDRIASHCKDTSDYLLPDTPLKEAVFRTILAGGNQPMTPGEISEILSDKWAMTPYPREISPAVIRKLLDTSQYYCIAQIPVPETEEEPEKVVEEVEETSQDEAQGEQE